MIALEWGAGTSTVWLSMHVKYLVTIEQSERWINNTKNRTKLLGLSDRIQMRHIPQNSSMFDKMKNTTSKLIPDYINPQFDNKPGKYIAFFFYN